MGMTLFGNYKQKMRKTMDDNILGLVQVKHFRKLHLDLCELYKIALFFVQ